MPDKTIEPKRPVKNHIISIVGVLMVVLVVLIPLPAFMLDILWALNLILVLLIFLKILHSKKNEYFRNKYFSFLPPRLLILTIFGLSIQIAFTRLILLKGEAFDGRIIRTLFSLMMLPGEIIGFFTGAIVFIIFTTVIAMAVTRAYARIIKMVPRITLDFVPAKLMAIDAEYGSGAIADEEVIAAIKLQRESDFLGAIVGSGKFISAKIKASLFVTAVSIIAGIAIGKLIYGETIINALIAYTPLSLCNGFIAQFIGLMESIVVGKIVGMAAPNPPIRIEMGNGLSPFVDMNKEQMGYERIKELMELIQVIRIQFYTEKKIKIPQIKIVDNSLLEANEYRIFMREEEAGRWTIKPDCFLCINSGSVREELPGEKVHDPVNGLPALWASAGQREEAERLGYTVANPISVIASHLKKIIVQYTEEFPKVSK